MSDVDLEYARVRAVLERPTLRLMARPTSAAVIAVFRTVFDRDVQYVPAERLHLQVEEHVARLGAVGARVPQPDADEERPNGRALCREWVSAQWLVRSNSPDGDEQYSLTSHALEALSMVDALSAGRALISESRLTMIVDAVRRWAHRADPDQDAHLRRLDAQIAELRAERDRIADGGDVVVVDEPQMRDGYANLIDLVRQLPGDFKRVEEAVATMHREIVEDFRQERRPIGEVLDDYLARTDTLMSATPEGRAFEGAFELLRDDALLLALRDDIATILAHPFAERLSGGERRAFRNTVAILRQGIEDVLAQRRRLTTTLRDQIVAHDVVRDRELDATLRSVNRSLATWMLDTGDRARVPLELLPAASRIEHLRDRFHDPDADIVPPPLEDEDVDAFAEVGMDDLRLQGGPLLDELRSALRAAAERAAADGDADVGTDDVFNALPEHMRRPVELFGLAHLLGGVAAFDAAEDDGRRAAHRAVRPDGSTVVLTMPGVAAIEITANETATNETAATETTANETHQEAPDA